MTQAEEKHYTVNELAEMWSLCPNTVRKIFDSVDVFRYQTKRNGRVTRTTLRIPASTAARVYAGLCGLDFGAPVQKVERRVQKRLVGGDPMAVVAFGCTD